MPSQVVVWVMFQSGHSFGKGKHPPKKKQTTVTTVVASLACSYFVQGLNLSVAPWIFIVPGVLVYMMLSATPPFYAPTDNEAVVEDHLAGLDRRSLGRSGWFEAPRFASAVCCLVRPMITTHARGSMGGVFVVVWLMCPRCRKKRHWDLGVLGNMGVSEFNPPFLLMRVMVQMTERIAGVTQYCLSFAQSLLVPQRFRTIPTPTLRRFRKRETRTLRSERGSEAAVGPVGQRAGAAEGEDWEL